MGEGAVDLPPVDGRYLLYVGQARAHKGLPTLVDAFAGSGVARSGVRLVLVGRDFAPGSAPSLSVVERLGRSAVPLGVMDDRRLRALYANAVALVHPAEHEGFGFTPLEALASGTRVVAADIPALRETLSRHALFADGTDALASAVRQVATAPDDPTERERRVAWAARYRWAAHAEAMAAVYREAAR